MSEEESEKSDVSQGRVQSGNKDCDLDEENVEKKDESFEEGGFKFDDIYVPPPPATAFQANPDGSRLIITHIVNENFKSYANVQELGPFHKYFTAIIGPNGSGKSNVIDSMLFVFGYRATKLRSKKISALLHDSPDHPKVNSCTVTVHFALMIDDPYDIDAYHLKEGSEFYISRTACIDNSSYYTINGKKVQFKEVGKLLRQHGIDLDHNRFLILQGEVEQISLMKPKAENEHEVGMLEYLEDIIGSSRFKEPIAELVKRVEIQSEIRDEKWNRCKMAKNELEDLKAPMEVALKYVRLENSITLLNHKLLQKKILMGERENEKKKEFLQNIEDEIGKLWKNMEEKRKEIKEKETSNSAKSKELDRLSALKESIKASFDANKLSDIALQQAVENANKKRKECAKTLAAEEEKLIKLERVSKKNEQMIAELEEMEPKLEKERQLADENHSEIMESLAEDTRSLQDEKESLQMELVKLKKIVDKAKSNYEMSKTELELYKSQEENEKSKLNELKKRLDETTAELTKCEEELAKLSASIPDNEGKVKRKRSELINVKAEEVRLSEERRKHQVKLEEARVALHSNRGRGKVLDALMQQKQEGKLPGVFGRMGDLGGIDEKYDVAISTACGPLDNIVVDTVDTATACIQFLKENNIGSATFVALEKQERFREIYSKPFRSPENVPRLFDLIKVADERVRPVFYYALQDTLVANDLDQAVRIAYGKTRYRVVTLTGDLIEIAGTMTGGGNQVYRGRMGRKAESRSDLNPKEFDRMEKTLEETVAKLSELRTRITVLEDEIVNYESEMQVLATRKNKLAIEIQSLKSQVPMIMDQIKKQEIKYKESALDQKKLKSMDKTVSNNQKDYEKAKGDADVIESQVNKLHSEIIAKTKGRLEPAQKKLDEITEKLDKTRKEKTRLKVAITTAERNTKKAEERIVTTKQEIEECVERIKKCAEDLKRNEEKAQKTLEEFQKCEEELQALQEENMETKQGMDKLLQEENALKAREIDLKQDVLRAKNDVDQREQKIAMDKKKMKSLKLTEEPLLNEEKIEFKFLTVEELDELNLNDLTEEVRSKEGSLPKNSPNLGVIQEYTKLQTVYLEREKDLEKATNERNKTRNALEEFRKTRLTEFMRGFSVISQKVKECYQMLADGGDAELELVNTLDPFLDGIRFTVRPPKKSWKEIQYLSGGEKTLSSLSLIFALHYYKPTPLYFMDEIDAALDWKNTAIVGLYLKEQTKNAQFIVVSLRENMFEIADQLVGIYKTHNCTKSVTIIPHTYRDLVEEENSTEKNPQDGGLLGM